MRSNLFRSKISILTAVIAGFIALTAAAPLVRADDCQERVAKADHKLHEAIEHHGPQSGQAAHWRKILDEERERCWSANHRWWDEDEHRWRTDHDWHDHD
ncbi:MAG TPA: hypothetical protein VMJ13_11805 [Candidatus Acidoferrum sp.]|nr:hypothetical protein [Candidatus Acidoferrum sp.]